MNEHTQNHTNLTVQADDSRKKATRETNRKKKTTHTLLI